jgi:hypothetical protein
VQGLGIFESRKWSSPRRRGSIFPWLPYCFPGRWCPPRPVIVEGNSACERVRQKIADIYESWAAKSPQEMVEAERMIARTKQEYSYCNL